MAKFLIISGNFYRDLADELLKGATAYLESRTHHYDAIEVPGALEIPQAIRYAIESGEYDGFIALGTVIRGETAHYDVVAGESSRALMDLALYHQVPIGNGILTTETREQAWVRADVKQKNKGADAANAAVELYTIKQNLAS